MIRDHIVANLSIEKEDFTMSLLHRKAASERSSFGEQLWPLLDEMNEALAA